MATYSLLYFRFFSYKIVINNVHLFLRERLILGEAKCSYSFFLRFELENVLNMFLKLCGIVFP